MHISAVHIPLARAVNLLGPMTKEAEERSLVVGAGRRGNGCSQQFDGFCHIPLWAGSVMVFPVCPMLLCLPLVFWHEQLGFGNTLVTALWVGSKEINLS